MKNILICATLILTFPTLTMQTDRLVSGRRSESPTLQKTTALLKQISESVITAETIIQQEGAEPAYMSSHMRAQAVKQLQQIQEANRKLLIILQDTDGWVTQESEK